jgi:energy-coupling factor transporter ATP-binding protein EcfA2
MRDNETLRNRSYSEVFERIIKYKDKPLKFLNLISENTNKDEGYEINKIINDISIDELKKRINTVIIGGCKDEWEFLFDFSENILNGNCVNGRSNHKVKKGKGNGKQSIADIMELNGVFGKHIQNIISKSVEILSWSILSQIPRMITIQGDSKSGKSKILPVITEIVSKNVNVPIPIYTDVKSWERFSVEQMICLAIDDSDLHLAEKTIMDNVTNVMKIGNIPIILTCSSIPNIFEYTYGVLAGKMENEIFNIPPYDDTDIINIIKSSPIRKTMVSDNTFSTINDILYSSNSDSSSKLKNVRNIVSSILYPVVLQDFKECNISQSNQTKVVDVPYPTISRAVKNEIGDRDEIDSYISQCNLPGIENNLKSKIIGQDRVIDNILPSLSNAYFNISDQGKPLASYLFFGPSGVGKTEMSKVIADIISGGNIYEEDMNTYQEKFSVSKLTGAAPGYIGYGQVPPLLEYIKKNKKGVIVLNELDKAHPDVILHIMQIIDEGKIKDSSGFTYNASKFIIIATGNYCSTNVSAIGFGKEQMNDRSKLSSGSTLPNEVVGRFQCVVEFEKLSINSLKEIATLMLQELSSKLCIMFDLHNYNIPIKKDTIEVIISKYDDKYGARSMKSYVDTVIKNKMVEGIMQSHNATTINSVSGGE